MLIVGINYAPEPTGIAPYTSGLATGLAERGHDVRVLTTFAHYPQWRVAAEDRQWTRDDVVDGIAVRRVRHYVPAQPVGVRRVLSEVSFGLRAIFQPWHGADTVIVVSPALFSAQIVRLRHLAGKVFLRRKRRMGVIVQDIYHAGLTEAGRTGLLASMINLMERRVLRGADGVAVIHQRFATRLRHDFDIPFEHLTVTRNWSHLPPPIEFDAAALRDELGWGPEGKEIVVLHTGAMGDKQDLGNVVEAARLADAQGDCVRFVLMGDGGQRHALEAQAQGVESIEFRDPAPEEVFARILQSADLLLVNERPGSNEMAVPSKLTSYFQAGRPVLAATEPGSTTAEELAAARAGRQVAPGAPAVLLRGVFDMIDALNGPDPEPQQWAGAGARYSASVLSERAALDAYSAWVEKLRS